MQWNLAPLKHQQQLRLAGVKPRRETVRELLLGTVVEGNDIQPGTEEACRFARELWATEE